MSNLGLKIHNEQFTGSPFPTRTHTKLLSREDGGFIAENVNYFCAHRKEINDFCGDCALRITKIIDGAEKPSCMVFNGGAKLTPDGVVNKQCSLAQEFLAKIA